MCSLPNVVAVASTDKNDRLSAFSNFGFRSADIAAPGSSVLSCGVGSNSDYQYLSGTSMAAPHVSGAIALAKARFPDDSGEDLITRTYSSVDFLPEVFVGSQGRLNLRNLLAASTPQPYHDSFTNPYVIAGCEFHWCGSNNHATREADEDVFSPGTGTRSYWFSWKAPEDGLLTFEGKASQGDVSVVALEGND